MNWIFEHREFVWGMLAGAFALLLPVIILSVLALHAYSTAPHQNTDDYDPWHELKCEQCGQLFLAGKIQHDPECPICTSGRGMRV